MECRIEHQPSPCPSPRRNADASPCPGDRRGARALEPARMPPPRGVLAGSKAAGRFRLDTDRPLHLAADTDLCVEVLEGRVWLTDAGDHRDHFPGAGTWMAFAAGSDLMIEAEGEVAWIRVVPVRRAGLAADGLGHRMGFATPGRPLLGIANLVQRLTHGFMPVDPPAPSLPLPPRGGTPSPEPGGWLGWFGRWAGDRDGRRVRSRVHRELATLDSRQLRDIGAPDWVLHARESREREARMRTRMAGSL